MRKNLEMILNQTNRLDFINDKKPETVQSVCNVLKKVAQISNTNLIKNANGLLNKIPIDIEVEWVGKHKLDSHKTSSKCPVRFFFNFRLYSSRILIVYCYLFTFD